MKLRELLKKIRLRPLQGEGQRPIDDVDAGVSGTAPTNWVPSQQDERPRH